MSYIPRPTLTLLASLLLALAAPPARAAEKAEGVVAGWDRHNGQVLLGELHCAGCHDPGQASSVLLDRQPPVLAHVGARVTPQYLRAFLADPQKVKPGAAMPDLLHALPGPQREETVDALVHYLASLGGPIDQRSSGASIAQIERGGDLYHSVGCVACHEPFTPPPAHKKDPSAVPGLEEEKVKRPRTPSVPHGDLASKTTVEALAAFLQDPLKVRPSGRMPAFPLEPGEARMLAAYLLREQYSDREKAPGAGLDFAVYEGGWSRMPDFAKLAPRLEGDVKDISLDAVMKKLGKPLKGNFAVRFHGMIDVPSDGSYRFWTRSDDGSLLWIDGKKVVDNDGAHPPGEKEGRVDLKKGRHTFELSFFQAGGGFELSAFWQPPGAQARSPIPPGVLLHSAAAMIPRGIVSFEVDPGKAARGKELFGSLGCASCHSVSPASPVPGKELRLSAPALAALDPAREDGCAGENVAGGQPRYALADAQRKAIRQAVADLKKPLPPRTPAQQIDHLMASLSCYSCHARGEKGGPDDDRADYFGYDIVVDLGDEGRLPPSLDLVGARLTPAGFEDALINPTRYRTYMATRMPRFGKENVGHLPDLLGKADAGKVTPHKSAFSPRLVEDGRKLVGKTTLGCINCHAWGGHSLPGAEGLDLMQVTRRIEPGYFQRLLLDPQQVKPRTRMPTAWPQGKSFFPDVQGGDAHRQIDAIWAYLSVGIKGGFPAGLAPDDTTLLVPTTEPVVFRTFLDRVSAHAILVGFPERTHLAFDANRVRTVVAWGGDFVSTRAAWEGRAGQYAKVPSEATVWLPEGPPFATLKSLSDPWPADVPKGRLGSSRTPEGWRFLGYRFDAKRNPTFRYRVRDITVEESPSSGLHPGQTILVRGFRLLAPRAEEGLYLRLAAGEKIEAQDGGYAVDGRYRVRVSGTGQKPVVRDTGGGQELVVPITFRRNGAGKDLEAALTAELMW